MHEARVSAHAAVLSGGDAVRAAIAHAADRRPETVAKVRDTYDKLTAAMTPVALCSAPDVAADARAYVEICGWLMGAWLNDEARMLGEEPLNVFEVHKRVTDARNAYIARLQRELGM
jgi:hypothetical protein